MKATHRVKDSLGNTKGFIVDDQFLGYYTVFSNINRFENLKITSKNIIKSTKGTLPIIDTHKAYREYSVFSKKVKEGIFKRDIQKDFEYWHKKLSDYILMLNGARQIGKTTEILKFAIRKYEQIIYVNAADTNDLLKFVSDVLDSSNVFLGMCNYCREKEGLDYVNSSNTVLIIDEIQASARIYNSLRKLHLLSCNIIVTGSYYGRLLQSDIFQPAGDLYTIEMSSLSFREFCRAFKKESEFNALKISSSLSEEDRNRHKNITALFNLYLQIGGYPAVVNSYYKDKDLKICNGILNRLLSIFIDESLQYFKDRNIGQVKTILEETFKYAAMQMLKEKQGEENNNFFNNIKDFVDNNKKVVMTAKEISEAFSWLYSCRLIDGCDQMTECDQIQTVPFKRAYFRDVGFLNAVYSKFNADKSNKIDLLTETFVYNEILRKYNIYNEDGLIGERPYFATYKNNKYELDFVIVTKDNKTYGIEVKSGNAAFESLKIMIRDHKIDFAILAERTMDGGTSEYKKVPIYLIGDRFPDYK